MPETETDARGANAAGSSAPAAQLSAQTKQQIRDALAGVAETPGFRSRATQRLMIAEVAKTLAGEYGGEERVLCVEGPTGTGKSLGYLLSAIPVAQARDKTLVISTATVALQEQLVDKDLPELQRRTDMDFSFALAKGRRRYVCDRDLEHLSGADQDQGQLDFGTGDPLNAAWHMQPEAGELEQVQRLWQARQEQSFDGDLDTWPEAMRAELRQEITTDSSGCTGKNCPFHARCAFLNARRKLYTTDVVVANHALVMSDLLAGGGLILPEPSDCIYIFDEGHHLPGVAIDQGAAHTRLAGPQSWLDELTRLPTKAQQAITVAAGDGDAYENIKANLVDDVPRLMEHLKTIHRYLSQAHPALQQGSARSSRRGGWGRRDDNWRFAMGNVPQELAALFEPARAVCEGVHASTLELDKKVRKAVEKRPDERALDTLQSNVQWLSSRLEMMHAALGHLATQAGESSSRPPVARWIKCVDGGQDFECCASPTSAANLLRRVLWQRCDGAVVTSGTLAALGRFDRFFEQAGLGERHGTQALRLASPFDYGHNATLSVPAVVASPKQHGAHTDEIIDRMEEGLIDTGAGTLVLFASHRQMRAVAEGLEPDIGGRVLMQGTASRQQLLSTHRQRIDAGEGSILFGVSSFSEGIDLPGAYCSHVIIAKIPFAVPDSPVDATYAEWLEANGRNPFMAMAVPEAGFRLVQAAGRLLRTEADTGRVTVLDRRLADMPYGRLMLDALPPFRREIAKQARS